MKISHGRLLRTFGVFLFSVTLVGGVNATPLSDAYEGMIAAALAKPAAAEKIEALSGFASVAGSIDAETAKEINPEFTTALTSVYNASQADSGLNAALKKMLQNAMATSILDEGQKATVTQWINGLKDTAPALAPVSAAPVAASDLSSQAKTLNVAAMQQLATVDTVVIERIKQLDQEADDGKRLEGIYNLLQEAQGKTLSADVQEHFGRLLVKAFNEAMEIHSYLQQVLNEAIKNKTPLLAQAQLDYVKKEMLSRVNAGANAEDKETQKDGEASGKKNAKKTLKKGKGRKDKAKGKGKGKKSKKSSGMVDRNNDGKDDRDSDNNGVVTDAEKTTHAAAAPKKGKKGKKVKHPRAKKRAAEAKASSHDATAPAQTGDSEDVSAA